MADYFLDYEINYTNVEKWIFIDIALVKVESEYDLKDTTFKTLCSYIPTTIDINYWEKFQKPNTSALVYGWGHLESWRQVRVVIHAFIAFYLELNKKC